MNLGENIYRLRTSRKMSQDALAEALEVSRQSVSKWENNMAVPDLDKLIKMRDLFGITLDELVAEEPPEPGEEPASKGPSPSLFETHRRFLIIWGVYLAAAYLLYRPFIRHGLGIPLVAMQAGITLYTLNYFRDVPYPFGGWRNYFLGLCGWIAYFFGLRLYSFGTWSNDFLAETLFEQIYVIMLILDLSVTILIKAGISWWKSR